MFQWLNKEKINPVTVMPGDKLILELTDEETGKVMKKIESEVGEYMLINEISIFKFKDDFGMKEGFGGICGNNEIKEE